MCLKKIGLDYMLNDQCNWGREGGGGTWSSCGSGLAPTLFTLENHNYNMGDRNFYRLLLNI